MVINIMIKIKSNQYVHSTMTTTTTVWSSTSAPASSSYTYHRHSCLCHFKKNDIYLRLLLQVHRIKKDCFVQAGDVSGDNSGVSNGDANLMDESFKFKHSSAGFLGAASGGQDQNGSQFYVTLKAMPAMDGRFCIFGRVISGFRAFKKMNKMPITYMGRPLPDEKTGKKDLLIESGVWDVKDEKNCTVGKSTSTKEEEAADAGAGAAGSSDEEPVVPNPTHIELDTGDASKEEIDAAATKMQATFRGKKARAAVKERRSSQEIVPKAEVVELDTGDASKEEIDAAATKMQATFRGKKARAATAKKKEEKVHYVSTDNV